MAPRKQPNPIDIYVGNRLKMRRNGVGMTQEKLGDRLGVTFQQVQKYEKGANRIGASRLQEIASILSVPVSYFFEGAHAEDTVEDASERREGHRGGGITFPTAEPSMSLGFAEDGGGAYTATTTMPGEARELARAFSRIGDARVRRRIIDLVETLADARRG